MPKADDLESSKHVSRESTCTDPENVQPEKAPEPEVEIVELEGEENPRQWRLRKKATMLALASLFSLLSPLASSITAPCIPLVLDEFHRSSQLYGAWILSVYVLGYAFGPILCAPLSELYGRQVVYHSFNSLFLVFIIACAVAPSIESLIGFRFLAGVAGACAITLGSATIGDMIVPARRGIAIGLFAVGPLAGPAIGPIVGGFVAQAKGWRWVYWVLAMALGALLLVSYVLARETYAPVLLRRKIRRLHGPDALAPDAKIKRPSLVRTLINAISRPLQLLFLSPIVMCLSLYSTFVYGIYYLFLTTMSETFEKTYGFSRDTVGLAFIGLGVGSCTGTLACGAVADLLYKRISAKGMYRPEHRLIPLIPCTLFTPVGLFWFGWSVAGRAHWIVPIIGTVFIGVGLAASFMPMNYLIDAYPKYAASAVAANTILRSIGGAVLPLAGPSLYRTLGQGWGNSLLAFLSLLACPMALALFKYGERLRLRSRFNSND